MKELKILITKLTNLISKQESRQKEKPTDSRLAFLGALARARNDLLDFKEKHGKVLSCIL